MLGSTLLFFGKLLERLLAFGFFLLALLVLLLDLSFFFLLALLVLLLDLFFFFHFALFLLVLRRPQVQLATKIGLILVRAKKTAKKAALSIEFFQLQLEVVKLAEDLLDGADERLRGVLEVMHHHVQEHLRLLVLIS